jgi:hypothetical protein
VFWGRRSHIKALVVAKIFEKKLNPILLVIIKNVFLEKIKTE